MTIFSAYDIIHAWCEQNKPLKRSLIFFGNEYVNYVIDGKVFMKLSVGAREKNYFKAKKAWTPFLSLSCVKTSVGVPFGYRKSLERTRRMRNVTICDFRQVHLEPVKNAILSPVITFDWRFYKNNVFYQSQFNTDHWLWCHFQHTKD